MAYTILPSLDNSYITIKIVGNITGRSALEHNIEAHALGRKLGINKFLMDATEARNTDTVIGNYKFAYEDMTAPQFDPSARIAVVVSKDDNSHDFVITASKNSGVNVEMFHDIESAIKFLKS